MVALEGHAVAAATWIVVCGRRLYEERDGVRMEFETLRANLEWILECDGLNEDIKAKLQEAKVEMDAIGTETT